MKFFIEIEELKVDTIIGVFDEERIKPQTILISIKCQLDIDHNQDLDNIENVTSYSDIKKEIFDNINIYFNIVNGKINFNQTRLINKKIGLLELENSNLSFIRDRLILNTDIIIDIKNSDKLYSLLQTNKKDRKPIKNVLINLDYDFLTNQFGINNLKINNKKVDEKLSNIIKGFNDDNFNNWNKSRRFLNILFEAYEG